jgi:FAD dependent oxidoreductase
MRMKDILRFPSRTWLKILIILFFLLLVSAISFYLYLKSNVPRPGKPQPLAAVQSTADLQDSYDVIVVGTDPEGIAAAVSSARNGLKTLLIDGREREILGGLMTIGWLNSLDHNYDPNQSKYNFGRRKLLNGGIFKEWYGQVEGDSFDVHTAANAFYNLVRGEPNIDLSMKARELQPLVANQNDHKSVKGIQAVLADGTKRTFTAPTVIDATQDADIAFAAGIPFTKGREDIGDTSSKMAVTVVFRINNVTDEVWDKVKHRLNSDDDKVNTGANELSAWGYQEMWDYVPVHHGNLQMRGLNIGRQNDQTALINALQIFNVDLQNKESVKEAFDLAKANFLIS